MPEVKRTALALFAIAIVLSAGGLIWWMVREQPSDERSRPVDLGGGSEAVAPAPAPAPEPRPKAADPRPVTSAPQEPIAPAKFADPAPGIGGVVQNEAGSPLDGAVCELYENLSPIRNQVQEGEIRNTFTTKPDGFFGFDGNTLSVAERYLLKVSHPEYATDRRAVDLRSSQAGNLRIRLSAGTRISGTVRSVAGVPLAHATITVYEMNASALDPAGSVDTTSTSDARGAYTVTNANAGLKKLTASLPGYGTGLRPTVKVDPGQPLVDVDFFLPEGGSITGRVTAQGTGEPVANAWVTARVSGNVSEDPVPNSPLNQAPKIPADVEGRKAAAAEAIEKLTRQRLEAGKERPELPENTQGPVTKGELPKPPPPAADITGRTQADGTYVLTGAVVGRVYAVSATSAGYVPMNPQTKTAPAQNVDFILAPSARILGRVVDDETGKPVPMFTIALTNKPDEVSPLGNAKRAFGPPRFRDGTFEYADIQPGHYWLLAQARGYAGGRSQEIAIGAGDRREGVEIRIVRGADVKGRVVDAKGAPVADATVDAEGVSDRGPLEILIGPLKDLPEVKTHSDGTFVMPALLAGSYVLGVRHPDFAPYKAKPLAVPATGQVTAPDIVLARGATIRGRVRLKDGRPDAKAVVMLTAASTGTSMLGQRQDASTDDDGRYEISGLAAGQYRIIAVQRDGQRNMGDVLVGMNATPFALAEGEIKEVDL